MSSLYSVNYHLRAHKRDGFIEFIKSLLLTPFVLHTRPGAPDQTAHDLYCEHQPAAPDSPDGSRPTSTLDRYLEILGCVEDLIVDHLLHTKTDLPELSRLSSLVPTIGRFFTPLPLRASFLTLNAERSIAGRRSVPPSFNDIRHLLNLAQTNAIAPTLKLITFDGDMTLYADGADFARDSQLVQLIVGLLRSRISVAIVTAAGYPGDAARYEKRLSGLLEGFQTLGLDAEAASQFYVLGGECNYLFRYDPSRRGLVYIPEDTYQPEKIRVWSTATSRIQKLLDVAEANIRQCVDDMNLQDRAMVLRKDRAIGNSDEFSLSTQRRLNHHQHALLHQRLRQSGFLPGMQSSLPRGFSTSQTSLETTVATAAAAASVTANAHAAAHSTPPLGAAPRPTTPPAVDLPIPFCAFNGGSDMWLDIGNKLIGVGMLQEMLGCLGHETLHVGDQFLSTGNDIATRSACSTVWITSPEETADVLTVLARLLKDRPALTA
ncbi:IMP-specific 5-nucleotidase [Entophlyctis helioformis]|nr:IMP-specific 5-nucleotidase [Entophlyctis helioformis]